MKPYQQQFIQLALEKKALKFGNFTLKSGRKSPYFFNSATFSSGLMLQRIGEFYAQAIMDSGIEFDMIFGAAYKGIPLVASTAIALARDFKRDVPYCFNRKQAKTAGEGGMLVGSPLQGRVLIIDDVITAGTAARISLDFITGAGATAAGMVIAFDRQERGQTDKSAIQELQQQMPVLSLVKLTDLIGYLQDEPSLQSHVDAIQSYQAEYAVTE